MILAKESPYAAWRPCATVIGPVGLTLTNSSRTVCPEGFRRPYPSPAESNALSSSSKASEDNQKLMNPGPETSTFSRKGASSASAISRATSRGLRLKTFAFANATFVAKSPWAASFGRSTWMPSNSTPYALRTAVRKAPATCSSRPDLPITLQQLIHQPLVLRRHPLGLLPVVREAYLEQVSRLRLPGQQLSRHVEGSPPSGMQQQHCHPIVLEPVHLH